MPHEWRGANSVAISRVVMCARQKEKMPMLHFSSVPSRALDA
jgi:hypothetical protein